MKVSYVPSLQQPKTTGSPRCICGRGLPFHLPKRNAEGINRGNRRPNPTPHFLCADCGRLLGLYSLDGRRMHIVRRDFEMEVVFPCEEMSLRCPRCNRINTLRSP